MHAAQYCKDKSMLHYPNMIPQQLYLHSVTFNGFVSSDRGCTNGKNHEEIESSRTNDCRWSKCTSHKTFIQANIIPISRRHLIKNKNNEYQIGIMGAMN